jgi:hypothetical protein
LDGPTGKVTEKEMQLFCRLPLESVPQTPEPSIKYTYDKVKKNGRRFLRVLLKGVEHITLPDSWSDKNIISHKFATDNNVKVRRGRNYKRIFELGDGTHVQSIGQAHIPCSHPGSGSFFFRRKRRFHVLMACAVLLMLGKGFSTKQSC